MEATPLNVLPQVIIQLPCILHRNDNKITKVYHALSRAQREGWEGSRLCLL